jgi:myo-inositol catabolism protein IolS
MRYTNLPGTSIRVSVIAMGSWALAGDAQWGDQSEADSIAATCAALDAGINFFDTAPGYGEGLSEQRLGKGLKGVRERAVIATKIGPDAMLPAMARRSVERSLEHLGTDYIDLLQIHWPSRSVPLEDTWAELERLREEGKVRALGVSNFGARDLAHVARLGRPSVDQLPYSLLSRAIEYEVVAECQRAGIGVLCYSPLLWGLLAGKYASADEMPPNRARSRHFSSARPPTRHGEPGCEAETFAALTKLRGIAERLSVSMSDLALAWLLHQPVVTSVLIGIRNAGQAELNARAADVQLDANTLGELDRATAEVKTVLGPNPDLWQGNANSRFR